MTMRWIVLILTLAFTVASIIATILPQFSHPIDTLGQSGTVTVTLFEVKTSTVTITNPVITVPAPNSSRINYSTCSAFKSTMRGAQAFAIIGIVCGFFAFLCSFVQCVFRLKMKLPLFIFILFASFSKIITVILISSAFSRTFCNDNFTLNSSAIIFKGIGYKLAIGFYVHIISLVGFVVTLILVPFTQQLWCGNC